MIDILAVSLVASNWVLGMVLILRTASDTGAVLRVEPRAKVLPFRRQVVGRLAA